MAKSDQLAKFMGKYKASIIIVTLLTLTLSGFVTLLQPMEYRSSFSLLIIERNGTLDGYAAAKSAERLSTSLGQIVSTATLNDAVYNEMKDLPAFMNNPMFSLDEQQRREEWRRHVETRVLADVGTVKVSVFQKQSADADAIATTLSNILLANGREYLSGGSTILFKVVDAPLTTKRPARPNIVLNLLAGLLLGLGSSIGFSWLRDITRRPNDSQMAAAPEAPVPMQYAGQPYNDGQTPVPAPEMPQPQPVAYHPQPPQAPLTHPGYVANTPPAQTPPQPWVEPAPVYQPYQVPVAQPVYAAEPPSEWPEQPPVQWSMPQYET